MAVCEAAETSDIPGEGFINSLFCSLSCQQRRVTTIYILFSPSISCEYFLQYIGQTIFNTTQKNRQTSASWQVQVLFVLSCFQHETKAKSLRIFEYLMPFKLIFLFLFEPDFITVHSYFVNYPKPRMLLKCVGLFCFPVFIFMPFTKIFHVLEFESIISL